MPIESSEPSPENRGSQYDVVCVGGGPSGSSAGIFTARAGMDTCVLDRGVSSLARCAYLENYLGFPDGIDVPTFRALCRAHAEAAGCHYDSDMVTAIRREPSDDGEASGDRDVNGNRDGSPDGSTTFVVETQDGRAIRTPRVVVATKNDTAYLDALDGDGTFTEGRDDGETDRYFDSAFVEGTGRTEVPGLYVAGPLSGCLDQAITSAGHGATVGFAVIEDWLVGRGYPPSLARGYWDWLSKEETRNENWAETTREFVTASISEDVSDERADRLTAELRAHTDALFVSREETERRKRRGYRSLLDHIDDAVIESYMAERESEEKAE